MDRIHLTALIIAVMNRDLDIVTMLPHCSKVTLKPLPKTARDGSRSKLARLEEISRVS